MKVGDKIKFKNDKHLKDVYEITRIGDVGFGFKGKNEWGYCDFNTKEFEIVKESGKMKELTFREVINRKIDKEYEIWEGEFVIVTIFQDKRISVVNKVKGIVILEDDLFTLKKQEYSFQEATEALIEGYEIESKISGFKYQYEENYTVKKDKNNRFIGNYKDTGEMFSLQESINLWYINK